MAKPTVLEIVKSVFSAFIGVQSDANRQKDFTEGSLRNYIIIGIIFTIAFVTTLALVVSAIVK
jgi:hypothetical protein